MPFLIVGLGNPGAHYSDHRHNVGAWFVEALANELGASFANERKFKGRVGTANLGSVPCRLLIPNTYMNESGQSVQAAMAFYKLTPENLLVCHDELDLEPGLVRFKKGGGLAGHNGLRDIAQRLSSREFMRLRFGIGHPGQRRSVSDFVLNPPTKDEREKIESAMWHALKHISDLFGDGQARATTALNSFCA